ncbi:hypothetical protein F2Q70_00028864 [Brassica cretica]|uniref:Uncharacterized protein n=1 Tax=Brassica cretica TaxID=69181 RepID=A0A8S9LFJ9_BRACR|nr:hypothetical protein F2Q70_00028864 [Brassica cretica]
MLRSLLHYHIPIASLLLPTILSPIIIAIMAALKGYGLCSMDSVLHFPCPRPPFEAYKRRSSRWVSPKAAVVPNFHLPMRSLEVKNRSVA